MKINLIWLLITILVLPQCQPMCPREQIGDFVWGKTFSTLDEKTSEPLCLDGNYLPVTRKCSNNSWLPHWANINCEYAQNDNWKKTFCPPNYNRLPNTSLCYLISGPQKWSNLCIKSTEADRYSILSSKLNYERYWLPIRRENRLDHLRYKILPKYNFRFNESLIEEPIGVDVNCVNLLCSRSGCKFKLSNCDNNYSMVCLIEVNKFFKFSQYHCSPGSYTTFNPRYHKNCYRIDAFNQYQLLHPLLINSEESQFLADSFVMTDTDSSTSHVQVDIMPLDSSKYTITGVRNFNRTNWIADGRRLHINFTNWDANFRNRNLDISQPYTTIRNGKWQLVEFGRSIEMAIHVERVKSIPEPAFKTFQFDETSHRLNITKQKFFLIQNCFLNDDATNDTNLSFGIGRKYFRCEGFTMKTTKLIKSPIIEVWSPETSDYEIFVVIQEKNCVKCDFIYESRLLQDGITSLKQLTFPKTERLIVQFRKIIDINVKSCITTFSLHVLVKKSLLSLKSLYQMLPQVLADLPYNTKNTDLRHINTCLEQSGKYFNFPDARIGDKSTNVNCRNSKGHHPTLKCIGDSDVGAYWKNNINMSLLTCDYDQLLQDVHQNILALNPVDVIDVLESTTQNQNTTIKSLELSHKIMHELLNNLDNSQLFDPAAEDPMPERLFAKLVKTYDNALQTSDRLVRDSEESENISSNFLVTYEKMIDSFLISKAANLSLYGGSGDGTYLIQEPNIILLVIDPFVSNVTGMSIHKKRIRRKENDFTGFKVKKIFNNQTTLEIVDRWLEAAINLEPRTITKLKASYKQFRIVLSVFYKDYWFMENSRAVDVIESKSKIIGVFIPEHLDKKLPEGISTILRTTRNRQNIEKGGCSNWRAGAQVRGWNKKIEEHKKLDRTLVSCPIRRTSFSGYVQLIGNDQLIDCDVKSHGTIIKWITIVMATLSVISVTLIFVAALQISVFATNETTPLILCLAFENGLQICVYILFVELKLFNADGNQIIEELCLATGAALHYLTLAGFFISLFATDHLIRAFVNGSNQLIVISFNIKIILFGWIVPCLIIGLCVFFDIFFDTELYLPIDIFDDQTSICYPVDVLLLYSIHIPIGVIVLLHLVIFVGIVIKTNQRPDSALTKVSRFKEKLHTFVYIFSILSMTWLFALIVYYVENCWIHLIFSYLFAITAPSQGFQIFLVCIAFNGEIQFYFKRWHRNSKL